MRLLACALSVALFVAVDLSWDCAQPRRSGQIVIGYSGVLPLNARGLAWF
jgi:hypothetical protein